VNLASRLEAHTKEARRVIIIDAVTREGLRGSTSVEALGPLTVRGKTQAVEVFGVLVPPST
jgi:class 3 adenylate cyclase